MILKTKVEYLEEDLSKLSDEDREKYKAKKEYLGNNFPENEKIMTVVRKDAIIDLENNLLYVDFGKGIIQLKPLLSADFVTYEDGSASYFYPNVSFEGNLEEIYQQLIKK